MRRLLILISCLAVSCCAAIAVAQDATAIIAAAPAADAFAGEDIVVLLRDEAITVDEAGRITRRVRTLNRLQTQWAMRRRSDVRVAWDSQRQDLDVITARTFMRDGTVVPTPDNGFNEVTPGSVSRAAPYLHWREMVISHVGTEPGCVTELIYEVRDREPGPLPPSGTCWLGGDHPVLESRVMVVGAVSVSVGLGIEDVGEGVWIARDLPALRTEGSAHRRAEFVPHVTWSRLEGQGTLASALQTAAAATCGPDLLAWLADTRDDAEVLTDVDLFGRIAALVSSEIADVHLPGGLWSATPRPVDEVFTTAVGTTWERTLVALALARAAGWEPEVALYGRGDLRSRDPLPVDRFTTPRVVVRLGDRNWWLSPRRDEVLSTPRGLDGLTGLFLAADGGRRAYTVPVREGFCQWHVSLAPDGDGWTATGDLVLRGPYRPVGRDTDQFADALASSLLPGGEVADLTVRVDTPQELSLRLTVSGEKLGDIEGGVLVRDLPWPGHGVQAHLPGGFHGERPARTAPLWVETPGREEFSLRLEVPDGWTIDSHAAGEQTLAGDTGRIGIVDNVLIIERTVTLDAERIDPTGYPAWRDRLVNLQTEEHRPLVIITD